MPNEPQPQGVCEMQGRQIEAPGLPALVLPVDIRRWVLADNTCLLIRDAMGSVPYSDEWEFGVVTHLGSHGARGAVVP
jgi:hypothetical protein